MHAIAQACGDPAMRLVGRIGQALLLTNSRNTPAKTGWNAVPPPSAARRALPAATSVTA